MKILIVAQTFPLTPDDSTAHFMYDFAQGFTELGHEAHILLPFNPKFKPNLFKGLNITQFKYVWPRNLHVLGYGRSLENGQKLGIINYLLIPLYIVSQTISLYKLVQKHKIDYINAHWILPNGPSAAIVSFLTGKPLVITLPGSDVFVSRGSIFFWTLAKLSAKFGKIVSNSPQLLRDIGIHGEVVQYGVPTNNGPRPRHKGVSIATAGRPVEKKGFTILKEICPEIEIISGLPVHEFRKKLLSIDIFIALSIRDSKGNLDDSSLTVFEAMAGGCAVIASDLPGYRLIIKNGEDGFLVNPKKTQEIKSVVEKLSGSSKLRQKTGKNARKKIKKFFTPDTIAKEYIRVFLKSK